MLLQYKGFILKLNHFPFDMAGKEIKTTVTKENLEEIYKLIDNYYE